MEFKGIRKWLVARRGSDGGLEVPPSEGRRMTNEAVEIQEVRARIAAVAAAREAHALVVAEKGAASEDLNKVLGEAAAVRSKIADSEREIALAGAEIPDEPFPEDAEIARLSRRKRIARERVRICEGKVRDSQSEIDARIRDLEDAWNAVGTALSERLLSVFRESARALAEVQLSYVALGKYFSKGWNGATWKALDPTLTLVDPMSREVLLNSIRLQNANKWPAGVHQLRGDMEKLRAEIDQARAAEPK
jgi:hypothetical protein